ncbi:MAG: hypothetical protein M3552_22905 [Planctomycetota bacterium]|nr:hypothetical protein [Planctomycetaceae bacterium]MDQ3333458.1 hypothetical protein [Planctomycetota bacterium]
MNRRLNLRARWTAYQRRRAAFGEWRRLRLPSGIGRPPQGSLHHVRTTVVIVTRYLTTPPEISAVRGNAKQARL